MQIVVGIVHATVGLSEIGGMLSDVIVINLPAGHFDTMMVLRFSPTEGAITFVVGTLAEKGGGITTTVDVAMLACGGICSGAVVIAHGYGAMFTTHTETIKGDYALPLTIGVPVDGKIVAGATMGVS